MRPRPGATIFSPGAACVTVNLILCYTANAGCRCSCQWLYSVDGTRQLRSLQQPGGNLASRTRRGKPQYGHRSHLRTWPRDRRYGRRERPDRAERAPRRWILGIQVDSSLGEMVLEVLLDVASASGPEMSGRIDTRLLRVGGPNWILVTVILALLALGQEDGHWYAASAPRPNQPGPAGPSQTGAGDEGDK